MGRRPSRNPTNWHPDWYAFLEVAARQVLGAVRGRTLLEVEDLISIGWLRVMRYRDPVPDSVVWKWVKREMFHELDLWKAGVQFDEDMDMADQGPADVGTVQAIEDLDSGMDLAGDLVRMDRRTRSVSERLIKGQGRQEIGKAMGVSREAVRKWVLKLASDPVMVEINQRQSL